MNDPVNHGSGFFSALWQGAAPLCVWAAHFAACYVLVAEGCRQGWSEHVLLGLTAVHWSLIATSLLALATLAHLTWRACITARHAAPGLATRVRLFSSAFALLASTWTLLPALWLPDCAIRHTSGIAPVGDSHGVSLLWQEATH